MSAASPGVIATRMSPRREWTDLAGVMTLSAGAALLSGLLSAAANKIIALAAGPAAIGLLATLQQIRETALAGATLNGQTALIQGVSSRRGAERAEFLRTATVLLSAATLLVAVLILFAPGEAARWAGLAPSSTPGIRYLCLAVALSSGFVYCTGLLNALGASRKLALLQLAGPGAMALLAWPAAHRASTGRFAVLLGASGAVTLIAALRALRPFRNQLGDWFYGAGSLWAGRAARSFLSISGAMLATSLAGSVTFLLVRAGIVRGEGLAGAGQFDAAWGISMNQVSLVLASLQTHYLPRLAGATESAERRRVITRVVTLASPASALVIAGIAWRKPFWIGLLFSSQFSHAALALRWTLLGDYLKVTGWILSIPMLARADMRAFLAADLAAAACFWIAAQVFSSWRSPSEAAAMAFVAMHAAHLGIGAIYVKVREGLDWRPLAGPWLAGLALAGGVSIWKWNA